MKGDRRLMVAVAALAIALVAGVGLAVSVFAEPEVLPTPTVTPHCKWEWGNVGVTAGDGGHTILEAVLTSNGATQAHSYTEWGACFDCCKIVSFQLKTASDPVWTDADYECEGGVLKIEETFGPSEAPVTIRIEVEGTYGTSTQSYTYKAGQDICTGQMEWFHCPPTVVGLKTFTAYGGWHSWIDRILGLFGLK